MKINDTIINNVQKINLIQNNMKINHTIIGFITINTIALILFGLHSLLKVMDMGSLDSYCVIFAIVYIQVKV